MNQAVLGVVQNLPNLKRSVRVFYDFVNMPEGDTDVITTINDERDNYDGTGVNSPTCEVITFDSQTIKSFKDETNKAFSLGDPALDLFDHSFEVWIAISSTDGIMASGIQIMGARPLDNQRNFSLYIDTAGKLFVIYGYTGTRIVYASTNAIFQNDSQPLTILRVRLNFEANAVVMYVNGEVVPNGPTEGNISTLDPTLYDNPADMHVGAIWRSDLGTVSISNTSPSNFYRLIITDKLAGPVEGNIQDVLIESAFVKGILDKYTQWQNELGVTLANIASKRADMVSYIFNGAGMPTDDTPDGVNNSYTGLMQGVDTADLVGAGTVRQIRWDILDGDTETWAYYQYVIPNSTPTNQWIFLSRGHGSEGVATNLVLINRCLSEGYNVFWTAMPKSDPDTDGQNTTTNAAVGTHGHEQLYADGVDTVSYNAIELFFASQVRGINYLEANFTVSSLYAIGLSGGGYTVSILAAIDTRITKTSAHRGFMPRSARYYPFYQNGHEPDFEQGGANGLSANCGPRVYQFFTDHPQLEIMGMCTDGGRLYGSVTHTNDAARFKGYTWFAWKDGMMAKAQELGGRYFQYVNQTTGESAHEYQPSELDRTFYEFGL